RLRRTMDRKFAHPLREVDRPHPRLGRLHLRRLRRTALHGRDRPQAVVRERTSALPAGTNPTRAGRSTEPRPMAQRIIPQTLLLDRLRCDLSPAHLERIIAL